MSNASLEFKALHLLFQSFELATRSHSAQSLIQTIRAYEKGIFCT